MSDCQQRVAPATPVCDSYGRTDGLTKTVRDVAIPLTAVDAQARTTIRSLAEVLDGFADRERHPVVRSGEREPIPHYVRSAVWFRDRGLCELCGTHEPIVGPWELDHIVPWSAGGADDTTNLRVLCQRHNQERSNYVDHFAEPRGGRRAATWWCTNCCTYSDDLPRWWDYSGPYVTCPIHWPYGPHSKSACRVARNYWWLYEQGDLENWHERREITEGHTIAYCAHCNAPGMTDRPL